jgi:hypothetical protein
MHRRVVMGLAFVLCGAVAFSSVAQTTKGGAAGGDKPAASAKPAAKPAPKADAKKDAGASAAAGGDAGASGASPTSLASSGDGGTAAPVATAAMTPATMDGSTYAVRLRDLESRVDELKDQIRRSHTRLALLSDTIMTGGIAGSRAEITFRNEMSSAFRLVRATLTLDGAVQYNRQDDTGALAELKEIPVFTGSVPPGDHTVGIKLTFQGNGYGVFTYLKSYRWDVPSNHSFTAVEGKTMNLIVTSLEKGGVTTPLNERPSIQWEEKVQALGAPGQAAAGGPSAGASGNAKAGGGGASGSFSIGGGTK